MLGATIALAAGVHRRQGWGIVAMAAAAAALPDWDRLPRAAAPEGYASVHRVWGHNLLVAPLLSGLVGALAYLCWVSVRRRPGDVSRAKTFSLPALAVWVTVGALMSLTHLLADVFYCGIDKAPDWPVALLWPFSLRGWAQPMVPWSDRTATCILAVTLIAACLRPRFARGIAAVGLLAVVANVIVRGLLLS
jgi:inner membrane protein